MDQFVDGREPPKKVAFGKAEKTEGLARRKWGLAESQGWLELEVVPIEYGGSTTRYKLVGIPVLRRLEELGGVKSGQVNQPRAVGSNRRKGQSYRHGGG